MSDTLSLVVCSPEIKLSEIAQLTVSCFSEVEYRERRRQAEAYRTFVERSGYVESQGPGRHSEPFGHQSLLLFCAAVSQPNIFVKAHVVAAFFHLSNVGRTDSMISEANQLLERYFVVPSFLQFLNK